jgi:hypothetical protein
MMYPRQNPVKPARCVNAALLLVALLLPILTIFGTKDPGEAALPICCRAHGKHHCIGLRDGAFSNREATGAPQLSERCPYQKMASTPAHAGAFHLPGLKQMFAVPAFDAADFVVHDFSLWASPQNAYRTRGPPEQNLPV